MSTRVAPLGLRLFLEGVEVPVIAANVTVQPDMPAAAAIQVIPTDMGLNLLPRTLVHLFYLDSYLTDQELEAARKTADKTAQTRATFRAEANTMDRNEGMDFAYKILFTGEVIGYNYRKNPSGRQLVLQCMDLSSYWDTCYQFFSDYSAAGNGLTDTTHQFVGAGSGQFDNLGGHQWVISNLINSAPKSPEYQNCKGLLGGLIHLLETVGGLRYRSSAFKGYRGVNDFFTIAELRYGLLSMLGAIEADKTSQQLYAAKAFTEWIRNGMTSMGSLVSFRDMLNHINRYIFHNIYPNPCAKYVPGGETTAKRTFLAGTTTFLDAPQGPAIQADLKRVLTSMLLAIHEIETAQSVGTDYYISQFDLIARAHRSVQEVYSGLVRNTALVEASKGSNSAEVASSLKDITSTIQSAETNLPVNEVSSRYKFVKSNTTEPGGIDSKIQSALVDIRSAYDALYQLLGQDVAMRRTQTLKVPKASYLFNQLFLPEAFFVAPPRCNVIFPDQYFDLSFSRNFMREVTRLASTGGLGMLGEGRQGAHLFNTTYIAPPIKDVRGKLLLATMSQGARVLLPHEVHSGIVPKFEWVTDGHRWGVKAQKGRIEKVNYLQRLANFQFFLHRWSARQLQVTSIFNPNIVAGLPGVVIDRSAPSPAVVERLEKTLRRRMLPTQFVGKIFGYTHAIGQQGGSTSVQFSYARTHRGLDDEFLGILNREIAEESANKTFEVNPRELAIGLDSATVQEEQAAATEAGTTDPNSEVARAKAKQQARTAETNNLRKTVVRMFVDNKLKAGISVPGLGLVKKVVKSNTTAYLTLGMTDALGIEPSYFDANKKVVTNKQAGVAVTVASLAGVEAIQMPAKIIVTYVQVFGSGRFERSGLSFEDAVRPSWFSEDVWKNDKVTKAVYEPLLGSMAITDDVSLGQDQQDKLLKRWKVDQTKRIEFSERTVGAGAGGEGTAAVDTTPDNLFVYTVVPGSIEETVDGLSLVYGMIKERSGNIHEFIREFTRRPIANMVDILGTQNLEFDNNGKVSDPSTMIEGFHSRAFGDYNTDVQLPEKEGSSTTAGAKALHALMDGVADPANLQRSGLIGRDEGKSGIRPELDPRGRARGRVRAYVEELQLSRGLLGS